MQKNDARSFVLALLLCIACIGNAQNMQPNQKFGKPTQEELTMKDYPADKDAPAVVLYSQRTTFYEIKRQSLQVVNEYKYRLKVLKSEGKEYANFEIPYFSPINSSTKETIIGVKGFTYNYANGNVEKIKLESSMISDSRINDSQMLKKIAMPQVKEGSVIELQYRLESDYYYEIDSWFAQKNIPVIYTEFNLTIPEFFYFSFNQRGFNEIAFKKTPSYANFSLSRGNDREPATDYKFVGMNIPAMKPVGYVFCTSAYESCVDLEIMGINVPGYITKDFTSTWEKISEQLMTDERFGGRIRRSNMLSKEQKELDLNKCSTIKEKVAALYGLLKKHLKWDGSRGLYGEAKSQLRKDGTGSSADMNFVLLNMMKDAGIKGYPVVMCSRDKGLLPLHASLEKLNCFVIAFANEDGSTSYIDAAYENGYIDVLPDNLLTNNAHQLVSSDLTNVVDLQQLPVSKTIRKIDAKLSANGNITGNVRDELTNNDAASLRTAYKEAEDSVKFVSEKAKNNGIEIKKYNIAGINDYSNELKVSFDFEKSCDATSNQIYVNPFVMTIIDDNPFTAEERILPIEFPHKWHHTQNVSLEIPEGYTIEEIPSNLTIKTEDGSMLLKVVLTVAGNKILARETLNVDRLLYSQQEYTVVKEMFERLMAKNKELLVLKKI